MHIEEPPTKKANAESPLRAAQGLPYPPLCHQAAQPENIRKLEMAQLELIQKQQQKKEE